MKKLGKILIQIPARGGSKRLPNKNLKKLLGQPLIYYAIKSSLKVFNKDQIYINSDSEKILKIANIFKINKYKRLNKFADDYASGDDFTYDFIVNTKPDTLVMINPVCPLINHNDIKNAILKYKSSRSDTLISSTITNMQVFCENQPINIKINKPLPPSQTNKKINILNWGVTIWNAKTFKKNYEKNKTGYLGTNRIFFDLDPLKSIKISTIKDFNLVKKIIKINKT